MTSCTWIRSIHVPRSVGQRGVSADGGRQLRCRLTPEDVTDRVVVAGGGIGGLATALALHRCEIPVMVLEKSEELRQEGTALGLLANGWRALEALSVAQELRDVNPCCLSVKFFTGEGRSLGGFALDDKQGDAEMRGVMRKLLLQTLSDALPPDAIQFNSSVASADLSEIHRPALLLADGRKLQCRVVVGADGVGSEISAALGLPSAEYQGNCAVRGISVFDTLPIPQQTICYYMGNGDRAGMYQVEGDKVYWFIAYNAPEGVRMENREAVLSETSRLVSKFKGPLEACLQNLIPESLSFAKLSDRVTAPFLPPGRGSVTLVGDAFHPMTPNLGQGGALALEDAVVLGRQLASVGGLGANDASLVRALRAYETERLNRAAVVTLRSRAIGKLLSLPYSPVVAARNALISNVNLGEIYISTARYNCGSLAA